MSLVYFSLAAAIGFTLILIATWADFESTFYGFDRRASAPLGGSELSNYYVALYNDYSLLASITISSLKNKKKSRDYFLVTSFYLAATAATTTTPAAIFAFVNSKL